MLNSSELFTDTDSVWINRQPSTTKINAAPEVLLFLKCLKLMWLKPHLKTANNYTARQEVFQHHFKIQNLSKCRWSMHTLGWKPLQMQREKWRRGRTLVNINAGYPFFNSTTEHIYQPADTIRELNHGGPWNSHVVNKQLNELVMWCLSIFFSFSNIIFT